MPLANALLYLVVYIVIAGVVIWLLRYLVNTVPLDEPFRRIANVVILAVGVIIVILLLLNFAGTIGARPLLL
jgi:hypothetical protein